MARWQSPAYCSGLENRRRLIAVQGFESLPRRQTYGEKGEKRNIMGNSIFEIPLMEFHYDTNMSLPTHGIMSITNRCNLACPYCFHT